MNRWLLFLLLAGVCCQGQKNGEILRQVTIYADPREYCAWPSMVRAANGDLLVTFSINEEHLGPDGRIVITRSRDNGRTWEAPVTIYDTPIDDRESGITLLDDGRLVMHYRSTAWNEEKYRRLPPGAYEPVVIDRWCNVVNRPIYQDAADREGQWCSVSTDNGHTWSPVFRGTDSIHGGLQLPDGTLLVASYRRELDSVGVYVAHTPKGPWQRIATVASPQPDSLRFGEPHILWLPSGRIIMMIRATAKPYNDEDPRCYLWCTYSDDAGRTWALPFRTPLWGFPPHLLLLSDGRVLCTYGYRRPPYGQRACISDDGITWQKEREIVLRDDACNKDLGYPVSVELEPGVVLSVYYQPDPKDGEQRMHPPDPNRSKPDILGTIWKVPRY